MPRRSSSSRRRRSGSERHSSSTRGSGLVAPPHAMVPPHMHGHAGQARIERPSAGFVARVPVMAADAEDAMLHAAEVDSLRCEIQRLNECHQREIASLRAMYEYQGDSGDLAETCASLRRELADARATISALQSAKPMGKCAHCDAFQKTIIKLRAQIEATAVQAMAAEAPVAAAAAVAAGEPAAPASPSTPTSLALSRAKAMVQQRKLELQKIQYEREQKKAALQVRRQKLAEERAARSPRRAAMSPSRLSRPAGSPMTPASPQPALGLDNSSNNASATLEDSLVMGEEIDAVAAVAANAQSIIARDQALRTPNSAAAALPNAKENNNACTAFASPIVPADNGSFDHHHDVSIDSFVSEFPPIEAYKPSNRKGEPLKPILRVVEPSNTTAAQTPSGKSVQFSSSPPPVVLVPRKPTPDLSDSDSDSDSDSEGDDSFEADDIFDRAPVFPLVPAL